jgi:hypothetical protein
VLLPVAGLALVTVGGRGTPWGPFLAAATAAVLVMTEVALARVHLWIGKADAQVRRHLAVVLAEQAGLVDQRARFAAEIAGWQQQRAEERRRNEQEIEGLVELLDAVRSQLSRAEDATAAASTELADLAGEWNALVQEAMQMGADVFTRRPAGASPPARGRTAAQKPHTVPGPPGPPPFEESDAADQRRTLS